MSSSHMFNGEDGASLPKSMCGDSHLGRQTLAMKGPGYCEWAVTFMNIALDLCGSSRLKCQGTKFEGNNLWRHCLGIDGNMKEERGWHYAQSLSHHVQIITIDNQDTCSQYKSFLFLSGTIHKKLCCIFVLSNRISGNTCIISWMSCCHMVNGEDGTTLPKAMSGDAHLGGDTSTMEGPCDSERDISFNNVASHLCRQPWFHSISPKIKGYYSGQHWGERGWKKNWKR